MGKAKARPADEIREFLDSRYEIAFHEILENWKKTGQIRNFYVKPGSLRTGRNARYEPDFLVIMDDDVVCYYEIKGPTRFAAKGIAKARMVAHMYPEFRFVLATGQKDGKSVLFRYEVL